MKNIFSLLLISSLALVAGCGKSSPKSSPDARDLKTPATPVKADLQYKTYTNARFAFTVSVPDVFASSVESDNGDGVTMKSADGLRTLKVWGGLNVLNHTGPALLSEAKKRVAGAGAGLARHPYYVLESETGAEGKQLACTEAGVVLGDKVFGFDFCCPSAEKEKFAPAVARLAAELSRGLIRLHEAAWMPLVHAMAFSAVLHYEKLTTQPDATTTALTLYNLVVRHDFRHRDMLALQDGAIYFSAGHESETPQKNDPATYYSPDQLYNDVFSTGKFTYPQDGLTKIIGGTQTGIAVYVAEIPYIADVKITSVVEKNDLIIVTAELARVSFDGTAPVVLGSAVITLQKHAAGFYGHRVVSFVPAYPAFADLKLK